LTANCTLYILNLFMTYTAAILRLPSNYISTIPGQWWYKTGSTNILQVAEFCPWDTWFKIYYLTVKYWQKTDWKFFQWCQWVWKALQVIDTATYHNKTFNHISVPMYISFVITNFTTSILDNLWELTIWMTQFLPLSLRNLKKEKKGWTNKM